MKSKIVLCLALFAMPAVCLAGLTPYQQKVVDHFAPAGSTPGLDQAYADVEAGKGTPLHLLVIGNSEMMYEEYQAQRCYFPILSKQGSMVDAFKKVIEAGHGPALVADARTLLGEVQWQRESAGAKTAQDQALVAAQLLSTGLDAKAEDVEAGNKLLRRRLGLAYYLSSATDGQCAASAELKKFIGKEAQ